MTKQQPAEPGVRRGRLLPSRYLLIFIRTINMSDPEVGVRGSEKVCAACVGALPLVCRARMQCIRFTPWERHVHMRTHSHSLLLTAANCLQVPNELRARLRSALHKLLEGHAPQLGAAFRRRGVMEQAEELRPRAILQMLAASLPYTRKQEQHLQHAAEHILVWCAATYMCRIRVCTACLPASCHPPRRDARMHRTFTATSRFTGQVAMGWGTAAVIVHPPSRFQHVSHMLYQQTLIRGLPCAYRWADIDDIDVSRPQFSLDLAVLTFVQLRLADVDGGLLQPDVLPPLAQLMSCAASAATSAAGSVEASVKPRPGEVLMWTEAL